MALMRETKDQDTPNPAPAAKIGRPTLFTPEVAHEVLSIIERGESLIEALEKREDLPAYSTVMRWLDHDEFRDQHLRARERSAWLALDKMIQIEITLEARRISGNDARVILENLRWRLSRMLRTIFGDFQPNQTTPQIGPITITAVMGFQPSETGQIVVNPTPINVQVTDKPNENNQLPEPVR